jgi:hypothetical protein
MATEPLLRYVACHRGHDSRARRAAFAAYPKQYTEIKRGPLKGCWRRAVGSDLRAVFKLGQGSVLEFHVVIRPGWPKEIQP